MKIENVEFENTPTLVIVRGIPGSGKSTFAEYCVKKLAEEHITATHCESTNIDMQVSTTVIHHGVEKTDPSAFSKFLNKMIKGDPKIIVAFDSLMEAKRAATVAEQEERRQHIRDSLVQYIHRRDSIRAELLREDSLRLELEKAKKVKIDYIAVIDDGITKRTVNVNSVVDTLTDEVTTQLGKTFTIMSVESAKERQKEIDRTKDYYKHLRIKTEQIL